MVAQAMHLPYLSELDDRFEIAALRDEVKLIELHDVIGPNPQFLAHHKVLRFDDIPQEVIARLHAERADTIRKAIGEVPRDVVMAYGLMLGLSTHDVAVLRGAFGRPEEVLSVEIWSGGSYYAATMRYPGETRCVFYTGIMNIRKFDEKMTVFSPERMVQISFPSPFLKSMPTMVYVYENKGGAYEEAFRAELVHFHECIVNDEVTRTPATEGRKDAELLIQLARTYVAQHK